MNCNFIICKLRSAVYYQTYATRVLEFDVSVALKK